MDSSREDEEDDVPVVPPRSSGRTTVRADGSAAVPFPSPLAPAESQPKSRPNVRPTRSNKRSASDAGHGHGDAILAESPAGSSVDHAEEIDHATAAGANAEQPPSPPPSPKRRRRSARRGGQHGHLLVQERAGQGSCEREEVVLEEEEEEEEEEGAPAVAAIPRNRRGKRKGGRARGAQDAGDLKCGDVQQGEEWRVVTSVGAVGGIDSEGGGDAQGQGCAPLPHILEGQSTPPTGGETKTKGKGKGKGKGRAKAQASGTPAAAPKATTKRRCRRRRSADTNANMSDSYSDNSDGGAGDSPCSTPIRRRPRSTRHQTRASAEWYTHPLPPPTTLEEPLVIDSDDDDVRAVPAAQGAASADKPSRVVTTVCDDDDGGGGVRRDSSFVDTDFGDGLIELRTRKERQGAPPGMQKVRLSWAVAYLREECIRSVPHKTRVIFPNKDTTGAVQVTRSDVIRLQENVFLNDTIIDFYLRYLLSREDSFAEGLAPSSVHAFSPLVVQGITNVADAAEPEAYWRKVQKWTKGLDLFSKKIVLFPINSALHWSLLVLINPDLFEKRVTQKEKEKEKEKDKDAAAAAARKKPTAPTAAAAAAAASAESTKSAKKKAGKNSRADTGANAVSERGDGGGGGGSSSSSSQSSTVSHTEGRRFQEDDDEEMPQAASPSRDAASLATAASAGEEAIPSSPPLSESEYLSQASPLPSRGKAMEWPPSTEIQRHSIPLLDDCSGSADADPTEAGGGGGGGGACTTSGRGWSSHGAASQPEEENAVAVGESGSGGVTTAGESVDRRNVESLPMEMEVEEEDQLPSRAGEIVGGGRTRLSSPSSPASPSPSPSATVSRGHAPPMPGSASGSPAASGSATSTPVQALNVEASNGPLHDGPESVLSPPRPLLPVGRGTKESPAIAADSRREWRLNQPSPSSPMYPSSPPCAGPPGERSGAAAAAAAVAAAAAAGGSQPSPGSADAGERPGREDAHRRRRRRRSPDPTAGGLDTTIAGRTTVRRRSVGVGAHRQEMRTATQPQGTGGPIDVDALPSNDEPGPSSGEPEPAVDVEALSSSGPAAADDEEVEALDSNAAAVVAETELRTRVRSTRSRRPPSRSTNGSSCKAAQLPPPREHSPPDSSSGDGKRPTTSGGVAVGQEEPGGGGGVADAGAVGLSSSPPDGDLDGGERAAGVEEVVDDSPIPCMLLLDSTKGHRSQEVFRMVRKYVEAAWNNTHGKSSGRKSKVDVTARLLGGCSPPIPQQTNDCDCGVYVIHYAKLILEKPPLATQRFLDRKGKGGIFSKKWFDSSVISATRKTIRDTVETMRWDCLEKERGAAAAATS
ncbi:conserved unknown protein [Ectocarpus siliculosus]|uniref:Ubiquitin-like protease family profile domain-containing protein n=1 Tax=Ectocarpus siliculosus TaxID=2880 RepID=D7FMT0_ECTSI|nr:conserved unknown protein [Ectocarpus siliculosus]|eukprot:CBJ29995.1 conserved unknown protein [Ectocarpus siliculosus]